MTPATDRDAATAAREAEAEAALCESLTDGVVLGTGVAADGATLLGATLLGALLLELPPQPVRSSIRIAVGARARCSGTGSPRSSIGR